MDKTLTLVIHGTFAAQAKWWRLGSKGDATFADRLEGELSRRGLSGSVWKPALAEPPDYQPLSWSGGNRHRDRVRGGRHLSKSLNQFAKSVQATPEHPLTVNFVAHSHGGNVVLEALLHLKPSVRVGRVVLLGTPLVRVRPAFRIARFVFSAVLLPSLLGVVIFLFFLSIQVARPDFAGRFIGPLLALLVPLMVIAYGWIFWAVGNILDVAWRGICMVGRPIAWLRGRESALVYGPSARKLATILGGRPILSVSSYNDEADLLLQVGSAPAQLYREYMATKFSIPVRVLEWVFLRPFVLGTFLKALEMFLQVLSLGTPFWRALAWDFEVASVAHYPAHLLVQHRLDLHPRAGTSPPLVYKPHAGKYGLLVSVKEVADELERQIQLRHSAYYLDDAIVVRVAEFLTGAEVTGESTIYPARTGPPPGFWDGLLTANVALGVLFTVLSPITKDVFLIATMVAVCGYAIPFYVLGIYFAIKERLPASWWHWCGVAWVIWACVCLLAALGQRLGIIPNLSTVFRVGS